jgi:hypothetical protein
MPYLTLLSIAHLLLVGRLSLVVARRLFGSGLTVGFATLVLVWMNLVGAPLALSLAGLLGSPPAYFAASIVLALLVELIVEAPAPVDHPLSVPWRPALADIRSSLGAMMLVVLLGLTVAGVVLVALAVLPNNWDSLAYRFPRPFFYMSSGGIVHPAPNIDPRLLFYPYNGSVIYLFLAEYQWPVVAWNFVGVVAWLVVGGAAFYLALLLGGSGRAALLSAYLVATAPIILCLANSTNDEIIASAPLLIGIVFAVLWGRRHAPQALYFAMLSVALGVGVKLHWLSLGPWLLFGALVVAWRCREAFAAAWSGVRFVPAVSVVAAAALLAGCSFITNYVSAGKLTATDVAADVLNRPFHAGAAAQTAGVLAAQMLLSPIPDHVRALGVERGRQAYETANRVVMSTLFAHVGQGPPYTSPYYRIRGLVEPGAEVFFEQSIWLGLAPHVCLLSLLWIAWERPRGSGWIMFLLSGLILWLAGYSALFRYAETIGTYAAYVGVISIAPLGLVWERMRRSGRRVSRALSFAFVLLVASNAILAGTLLLSSQKRNALQAFQRTDGETSVSATPPMLRAVVQRARSVHIPYLHWELLYWNVMRLNPAARYTTGTAWDQPGADLTIYSMSNRLDWTAMLPVRTELGGGIRLLGPINAGQDRAFCAGETCRTVCARCEGFFFLPLTRSDGSGTVRTVVGGTPLGLNPSTQGKVRFTLTGSEPERTRIEEFAFADLGTRLLTFATAEYSRLIVEVMPSGAAASQTSFPLEPDKPMFQGDWVRVGSRAQ